MKTIWKYALTPNTTFFMPRGTQILMVQEQHGEAQIWALVDPNEPLEERFFKTYGTGHDVPDDPGIYIGTFQLKDLVFHVFEVQK